MLVSNAAAVEERVDQPCRRLRLVRPEVVGVAEVLEDDLMAVRQVRQELAGCVLRRRREVERAADQQRLDVRVANVRELVLVRARGPRVDEAAAGPDQVGARAADHRTAVGVRRVEAPCVRGVRPGDRSDVAPDLRAREDQLR
jgi:hypothetical protein